MSAAATKFDPSKYCECQKCFSIHRKGSTDPELKEPAVLIDAKNCKYCLGSGFVDHIVDGEKLGVKRCKHSAPQSDMPF